MHGEYREVVRGDWRSYAQLIAVYLLTIWRGRFATINTICRRRARG